MPKFVIANETEDVIKLALVVNEEGFITLRAEYFDGDFNDILQITDGGQIKLCAGVNKEYGFKLVGKSNHVAVFKD
jgi:hypothetical protein